MLMLWVTQSCRGALGLAALVSGCVLSVDTVVPESGETFDPRLLGTWEEVAGADRAVVSRGTGNGYFIDYTSEGKVGRFEARLGRLGGRSVLDVWPTPRDSELQPYAGGLLAGHTLFVVNVDSNHLRLAMLQPDTLRAALRARQLSITSSESNNRLVLRGPTPELRSALASYLSHSGALAVPDVWQRGRGQ